MDINSVTNYWEGPHPREQFPWDHPSHDPLDTWEDVYTGWKHTIYTRELAADFLHDTYGGGTVDLFNSFRDEFPAARSDFFRVGYCLSQGGFYIDRRFAPRLRSQGMKQLLASHSDFLVVSRQPVGRIWNGFIACEPGNNIIQAVWDMIVDNVTNKLHDRNVWAATGPGVFSQIIGTDYPEHTITFSSLMNIVTPVIGRDENHWSKKQNTLTIYNM